jgi:hypothetical protein
MVTTEPPARLTFVPCYELPTTAQIQVIAVMKGARCARPVCTGWPASPLERPSFRTAVAPGGHREHAPGCRSRSGQSRTCKKAGASAQCISPHRGVPLITGLNHNYYYILIASGGSNPLGRPGPDRLARAWPPCGAGLGLLVALSGRPVAAASTGDFWVTWGLTIVHWDMVVILWVASAGSGIDE